MGLVGCDKQAIKPDKLILSIAFNESRGGKEGGHIPIPRTPSERRVVTSSGILPGFGAISLVGRGHGGGHGPPLRALNLVGDGAKV